MPSSTDSSEDGMAAVGGPRARWGARSPARPVPPSAPGAGSAGLAVVRSARRGPRPCGQARGPGPRLPGGEQDEQDEQRLHAERGYAQRAAPVSGITVIAEEAPRQGAGQQVAAHG